MKRRLSKSVRKAKRSFKKLRTRDDAKPGCNNGFHGGLRRGRARGLNIEGISPSKHLEGD